MPKKSTSPRTTKSTTTTTEAKQQPLFAVVESSTELYCTAYVNNEGKYNDAAALRAARRGRDWHSRINCFPAASAREAVQAYLNGDDPVIVVPARDIAARGVQSYTANGNPGEVEHSNAKKDPAERCRLTLRAALREAARDAGYIRSKARVSAERLSAAQKRAAEAESKLQAARAALQAAGMSESEIEKILG